MAVACQERQEARSIAAPDASLDAGDADDADDAGDADDAQGLQIDHPCWFDCNNLIAPRPLPTATGSARAARVATAGGVQVMQRQHSIRPHKNMIGQRLEEEGVRQMQQRRVPQPLQHETPDLLR